MSYDTQYRPAVTTMTSVNDAISTAFVRDLAAGVNNAKGRVMGPVLVCDAWPDASLKSAASGTDERVLLTWAPRTLGTGYNRIVWSACGRMETGTTGNCTLKLYTGQGLYRGPDPVTASGLLALGINTSSTLQFTTTAYDVKTQDNNHRLDPNSSGDIYLLLTAQNSVSGEQIELLQLTITAYATEQSG